MGPLYYLLAIVVFIVCWLLARPSKANVPPGLKGLPLFGNLFQVPNKLLFLKIAEWSKEYGPVMSYNVLGTTIVVLSTAKSAADVLDRMAAKTSDRPPMIKANEFLTRKLNFALTPKDEKWRILRKATHLSMNVRAVRDFVPMLEEETAIMVKGFLDHPEIDHVSHFHRLAASIGWRSLFGHSTIPLIGYDPSHRTEELSMEMFKAMLPGGSIVDVLPFLKPLIASSSFLRKKADNWFTECSTAFERMYSAEQIPGRKSMSTDLKENWEKLGIDKREAARVAGSSFFAAEDTTASALRYFFLAMALYPDSAIGARKQLDDIIGGRPPVLSDRDRLPYIEAVVKEVLRWRTPVPLSLPHAATEEFEYAGYTIPAESIIMADVYTIGRDPELYPNGDVFDPSRFIDETGRIKTPARDSKDDYMCFGHGRRICTGKDLAMDSLWIAIVYLLWAFEIKKGKDEKGQIVTPNEWDFFDHGVTVQPMPFPVELVPRFPN